jgi:hypothetical protein
MATIVNARDAELQALSPRMVTVALPSTTTIDFSQVNGSTKPSNNADVTVTAVNGGITVTGGGITLSSGGKIVGGKTTYGSGTGFALGYFGGAYKFDIGSSSKYFRWDGTDVLIKGKIEGGTAIFDGSSTDGSGNVGGVIANESYAAANGLVGHSDSTTGGAGVTGVSVGTGASSMAMQAIGAIGSGSSGYGLLAQAGLFGSTSSGIGSFGHGYGINSTGGSFSCSVSTGHAIKIGVGKIRIDSGKFSTGAVSPAFTNKPGAGTTVNWIETYKDGTKGWVPWVQDA